MSSIHASQIEASLDRARNIGYVTDTFTVDGCEITLRNLGPEELEAATAATKDLEDITFLMEHQREYLSRSICGLNGVDFTGVQFVEVRDRIKDVDVKYELHFYLRTTVVNTWSREVLNTAYHKLTDVLQKAENKAKEGVSFDTPDETPDEHLRRLVSEMSEVIADMPGELADSILSDAGLIRKSSTAELEQAAKVLAEVAPPAPAPVPVQAQMDPDEIMRTRKPITQQGIIIPSSEPPVVTPPPGAPAARPMPVIRPMVPSSRTAEIAAAEGMVPDAVPMDAYRLQEGTAELAHHAPQKEPEEAAKLVDTKPKGGINPRFQPRR